MTDALRAAAVVGWLKKNEARLSEELDAVLETYPDDLTGMADGETILYAYLGSLRAAARAVVDDAHPHCGLDGRRDGQVLVRRELVDALRAALVETPGTQPRCYPMDCSTRECDRCQTWKGQRATHVCETPSRKGPWNRYLCAEHAAQWCARHGLPFPAAENGGEGRA
jgi:hypothetical protein